MGTKASNARERSLIPHYDGLSEDYLIERPDVSDKYSDFKITNLITNESAWLEDKQTEQDRFMSTGVKYINGTWLFNGEQNIFTKTLTPIVNSRAQWFIDKYNITELNQNTDELFETLVKESNNGVKKGIIKNVIVEGFGKITSNYYNYGKEERCHYIQMGDNFYLMGENVLDLPNNIPQLKGNGIVNIRWCLDTKKNPDGTRTPKSLRTKTDTFFNVNTMIESNYSMKQGTKKLNPFI